MKKLLSLLAVVLTLGLTTVAMDAEAKRLGGGKSIGMQRQAAPPARAPDASPTAAPAAGAAGAGAAAASTRSKWMGPIAGLAAGLGLAALASHLGFGEGLANMLMIGLLLMVAFAAFRFFMARRAASQGGNAAYAGAPAGVGNAGNSTFRMSSTPAKSGSTGGTGFSQGGSMIGAHLQQPGGHIPADFDALAFVRHAKVNYMRLQAANDAGNLDDIRQFTSPEMFAEIQMDINERNGSTQVTRVLELNADVREVAEEDNGYIVSVHFTGRVQEDGADPEDISETWHMSKARQGSGGWVLAGIQQ
jgi:predicted lipid-binding transport protein (Tim44 family)